MILFWWKKIFLNKKSRLSISAKAARSSSLSNLYSTTTFFRASPTEMIYIPLGQLETSICD